MNLFPTAAAGRSRIGASLSGVGRFRGKVIACLAFLAGVFAVGSTVNAATCGKHFLVLKPGTRGALVSALVEQRNQEIAESHSSKSDRKCDSPQCRVRQPAPAAPSTPWTRITHSASPFDMMWLAESERVLSARSAQLWNEAGLLYDLEPAPPPTPPPRS